MWRIAKDQEDPSNSSFFQALKRRTSCSGNGKQEFGYESIDFRV